MFEVSEFLVSFGSTLMGTVIVYRPPYSEDHPITTGVFFHEFTEYLESVVMSSDKLLIIGYFDFYIDVPTNPNNKHTSDLLDAMGLVQHVKQATHIHAATSLAAYPTAHRVQNTFEHLYSTPGLSLRFTTK